MYEYLGTYMWVCIYHFESIFESLNTIIYTQLSKNDSYMDSKTNNKFANFVVILWYGCYEFTSPSSPCSKRAG